MAKSKISQLIEAGQRIEKNKAGFTVNDLLSTLSWGQDAKQYIQNVLGQLTQKGQARKVNKGRPVVYTFRTEGSADLAQTRSAVRRESHTQPANTSAARPVPASDAKQMHRTTGSATGPVGQEAGHQAKQQAEKKDLLIALENIADMEITLEAIGAGVFRRGRELERRIYELEMQLVDSKRNLDEANKRIAELNRVIERQNQTIASGNRFQRPSHTAKVKDVASATTQWKRRFTD